ncbi:unnamed protein product, partial [Mesorhabditis spiculigera]
MGPSSDEGLTLQYVTKRIIAVTSPSTSSEKVYKESLSRVAHQLKADHPGTFKIWNVSRARKDLYRLGPVVDVGWPAPLAPPLDRLCVMCKQWEQFLAECPQATIVVHSRGDPSRSAIAICAYMHYNAICANDDAVDDRFSMQRYADRYLGAQGQPSHKRYLTYFSNLLSGKTRVNPAAIYLQKIILHHLVEKSLSFKIYEKMRPVYSTNFGSAKDVSKFDTEQEVKLRGDILIKCIANRGENKETLFFCQFNTCALELLGKTPSLSFFKEELDLIFADPSIDNQCKLELIFSLDPPRSQRKRSTTSSSIDISRADSYESFALPEDDADEPVEYSRIAKPVSEDSGLSTTSPSKEESLPHHPQMGPPVPPKPTSRPGSVQPPEDEPQGEYVERRGVLPASVRPMVKAQKEQDAREEQELKEQQENGMLAPLDELNAEIQQENNGPATAEKKAAPSLVPDLVGKDRYDKASKCFSYVPSKALKEAFSQPKKPTPKRIFDTSKENLDVVRPEELSRAHEYTRAVDLVRRAESPKWTDTIDSTARYNHEDVRIPTSSEVRQPERPKWEEEIEEARKAALRDAAPYGRYRSPAQGPERSKSAFGERTRFDDDESWTDTMHTNGSRRTGSSYRQLDDSRYGNDMDDLCDPDFYLNYGTQKRQQAPKSEQLPRKQYRPIEDPYGRHDHYAQPQPVAAASTLDLHLDELNRVPQDRDAWRQRNCRSVTSAPERSRLTLPRGNEEEPPQDDWLSNKLKKLKTKREDPDVTRRRTQERMLLEELKNANDSPRPAGRDYNEVAAPRDPLEAYRREEERLRNTSSPFDDLPKRMGRGVRGKPPTPPPRERSRSPPQSRVNTPGLEQHYRQPHQNGYTSAKETNIDDDFGDFAHLGNIVKNENASPAPTHRHVNHHQHQQQYETPQGQRKQSSEYARPSTVDPSAWAKGRETPSARYPDNRYAEYDSLSRAQTPSGQFYSGQERVAAAIARAETPSRQYYGTQERAQSVGGRAETPNFPLRGETPLPYHPLLYSQGTASRPDLSRNRSEPDGQTMYHRSASPRSNYYSQSLSRRSSLNSVDPGEIIHHHPVFVKDVSKYWYKPTISREQAINMLRDKTPGTFVVRDSNSFPGAFGLALKVAAPPPGVQSGDGTELVRHFLIEPSPKGVKLKGCNNEPVFGSLSALVYQHSITPLALPAKLILPDFDPATSVEHVSAAQLLLEQGAACNVAYVGSVDCESLTGKACVELCMARLWKDNVMGYLTPVSVHFKVSAQGITLTDNTRKLFFRRHFPTNTVIYAGPGPDDQRWDNTDVIGFSEGCVRNAKVFAVVARKVNQHENQCHVFAELEPEQPAHAVLNFINKVLLNPSRRQ